MAKAVTTNNNGKSNGAVGRPTKLNAEVASKLFEYIKAGVPITTACSAVRLDFKTIQNWCERGEAAGKGEFFQFFQQYREARAEALAYAQLNWQRAMPTDWKACQAYLRVRDPDNYGERGTAPAGAMNISGEQVLVVLPAPASPKEWNKQVQQYLANGSGGNHKMGRNS